MQALVSLLTAARRRPWRGLFLVANALSLVGLGGSLVTKHVRAGQHFNAAVSASRRYDFVAARQQLQRTLLLRPNDVRAQLLATPFARRLDDYAEAERLLSAFE